MECVAATCTRDELLGCISETEAGICNAAGNDVDTATCDLSCKPGVGCVGCVDNTTCANPNPVCDVDAGQCRQCSTDDECPSLVCVNGGCADSSDVVYAAGSGTAADTCSKDNPCPLETAIRVTWTKAPFILRLLDGNFTSPSGEYELGQFAAPRVTLIGNANTVIVSTAELGSLFVRGVSFVGGGTLETYIDDEEGIGSCFDVELENVNVDVGSVLFCGTDDLVVRDSTLTASSFRATGKFDRVKIKSTSSMPAKLGVPTAGSFSSINSLYENVYIETEPTASQAMKLRLSFNTFATTSSLVSGVIRCESPNATIDAMIENNIVYADDTSIVGTKCSSIATSNILFPQTTSVPQGNIRLDPMFVDSSARNFALRPSSPAVDAALQGVIEPPTIDLLGTLRPQGLAHDIGAFELAP